MTSSLQAIHHSLTLLGAVVPLVHNVSDTYPDLLSVTILLPIPQRWLVFGNTCLRPHLPLRHLSRLGTVQTHVAEVSYVSGGKLKVMDVRHVLIDPLQLKGYQIESRNILVLG